MRTKRDMVLRALERGIEVSLRENRYVLDEEGRLAFLVKYSSDGETWHEKAFLTDCSFNYFTEMCDDLTEEQIIRMNFSTAMVEIGND